MIHFIIFTMENIFIKLLENLNFHNPNGFHLIVKIVNLYCIIIKSKIVENKEESQNNNLNKKDNLQYKN